MEYNRCLRCGKDILNSEVCLSGEKGSICMGCEFKKPDEIVSLYKDGDTIEAEFDGCLWYGELKGGFVGNPKRIESGSEIELKQHNYKDNKYPVCICGMTHYHTNNYCPQCGVKISCVK